MQLCILVKRCLCQLVQARTKPSVLMVHLYQVLLACIATKCNLSDQHPEGCMLWETSTHNDPRRPLMFKTQTTPPIYLGSQPAVHSRRLPTVALPGSHQQHTGTS
jgi:hypothetical protein